MSLAVGLLSILTLQERALAQPTYNDTQIVAGQRIGQIAIGMGAAQLLGVAGNPTNSYRYDNGDMAYTFANGVSVMVGGQTGSVRSINTLSSRYATLEGVHVGDSDLVLKARKPNWKWIANTTEAGGPATARNPVVALRYCYADGMLITVWIWTRLPGPGGAAPNTISEIMVMDGCH
jgi:hypothetical protein